MDYIKTAKENLTYIRLLNPIWFIVTLLLFSSAWLFYNKSIPYYALFILAVFLNPPVFLGIVQTFYLMKTNNLVSLDIYSPNNVERSLLVIRNLKNQIVNFSGQYPRSVYVSHFLFTLILTVISSSRHVNPTGSHREDMRHKKTLIAIKYFRGVSKYVLSYLKGYTPDAKMEALDGAIKKLPESVVSPEVGEMVRATHSDGEGFLSVLITLYDLYLCLLLPEELKERVATLFGDTVTEPDQLGWLSHRIYEFVLIMACNNKEYSEIERIVHEGLAKFHSEALRRQLSHSEEQHKYYVRDLLRQEATI